MNRRRFLGVLAGAIAAAAVDPTSLVADPERELWQPGKVTTFDLGAMPKARTERDVIAELTAAMDRFSGISLRLVREFSPTEFPARLDVLYGWAILRPDLAARISA